MTFMDNVFYIQLDISTTEFQNYYANNVKYVIARSTDGRKIQFPANILQKFVSHAGIQGLFKLTVDSQSKFQSMIKVDKV